MNLFSPPCRQPFLFTLFGSLIRGHAPDKFKRENIKRVTPHLSLLVRDVHDVEVPAPDSAKNEAPIQNRPSTKAPDQPVTPKWFQFHPLQESKKTTHIPLPPYPPNFSNHPKFLTKQRLKLAQTRLASEYRHKEND